MFVDGPVMKSVIVVSRAVLILKPLMVCSEAETTGDAWAQHSQQLPGEQAAAAAAPRIAGSSSGSCVAAPGFSVQRLPLSSCTLCKYFVYCWCDSIEA